MRSTIIHEGHISVSSWSSRPSNLHAEEERREKRERETKEYSYFLIVLQGAFSHL